MIALALLLLTTIPDSLIHRVAAEEGVPPQLAVRLVEAESRRQPCARNPVSGATGALQLLPSTARHLDPTVTLPALCDPERNLHLGLRYLATFHRRYGTWERAVVAFRFGEQGLRDRLRRPGWTPWKERYVRHLFREAR
jgi:soluble lytic murein transglycosylase-like protein